MRRWVELLIAVILGALAGLGVRSALVLGYSSPEWWVAIGTLTLAGVTAASILVTEWRERRRDRPVLRFVFFPYTEETSVDRWVSMKEGVILAVKNISRSAATDVQASLLEYPGNERVEQVWEQLKLPKTAPKGSTTPYLEAWPSPSSIWLVHSDSYLSWRPTPQLATNMWNDETEFTAELRWSDMAGRPQPVVSRVLRRVKEKELVGNQMQDTGRWVWYDDTLPGEKIEPIAISLKKLLNREWVRPTDKIRHDRSDFR